MRTHINLVLVLLALLSSPALAQENSKLPAGWEMRFDHPSASLSNVKFTINDKQYHFEAGSREAAIYYKPAMTTSGSYTLQGTFTQLQKTGHPEAYGLFVGGKNLQGAKQEYLYFLIRQDGKYLIKRRTGSDTQTINNWMSSDAVKALGDDGQSTNALEISCGKDAVKFIANGQVLKSIPRAQLNYVEGIAGLRINHHLHLNIDNFDLNSME
ncbi:MAG TPA: hypothetical protein VJ964_09240 [Balneolaceae bacterium]|nr:hypothetical protein [Balneolaceae bacterium]